MWKNKELYTIEDSYNTSAVFRTTACVLSNIKFTAQFLKHATALWPSWPENAGKTTYPPSLHFWYDPRTFDSTDFRLSQPNISLESNKNNNNS